MSAEEKIDPLQATRELALGTVVNDRDLDDLVRLLEQPHRVTLTVEHSLWEHKTLGIHLLSLLYEVQRSRQAKAPV